MSFPQVLSAKSACKGTEMIQRHPLCRGHAVHMPVSGPPLAMPAPRPPPLDSGLPHHHGIPSTTPYPYTVAYSDHPAPPHPVPPHYPPAPLHPQSMPTSGHPQQRGHPSRIAQALPCRSNDVYASFAGMEGAVMSHPGFSADGNFSAKIKALKHVPPGGNSLPVSPNLGEHSAPQVAQTVGVPHGQSVHVEQTGALDPAMPTLLQAPPPPPPPRPPTQQPPPPPPPPRVPSVVHESPQDGLVASNCENSPQQDQKYAIHAAMSQSQQLVQMAVRSEAPSHLEHLLVATAGKKMLPPAPPKPQQLHPEIDAPLEPGQPSESSGCIDASRSQAQGCRSLQPGRSGSVRKTQVETGSTPAVPLDEAKGARGGPVAGENETPRRGRGRAGHAAPGRGVRGQAGGNGESRGQDVHYSQGIQSNMDVQSSSDVRAGERGPHITAGSSQKGRGDAWMSSNARGSHGEGSRSNREVEGWGVGRTHGGRRDHGEDSGYLGRSDGQQRHDVEQTARQHFGRGRSHRDSDGRGAGRVHTSGRDSSDAFLHAGRSRGEGRHLHDRAGQGAGRGFVGGRDFREPEGRSIRRGHAGGKEPLVGEGRSTGRGQLGRGLYESDSPSGGRGHPERQDRREFEGRCVSGGRGKHVEGTWGVGPGRAEGRNLRDVEGRGAGRGRGRGGAHDLDITQNDRLSMVKGRVSGRESEARRERSSEREHDGARDQGRRGGREFHERTSHPSSGRSGAGRSENRRLREDHGSSTSLDAVTDGVRSGSGKGRGWAATTEGDQLNPGRSMEPHGRIIGNSPRGRGAIKAVRGRGERDIDVIRGHGGRGRRGDSGDPTSGNHGRSSVGGSRIGSRAERAHQVGPVGSWASDGDSASPTKARRVGRGNFRDGRRSGDNAGDSIQLSEKTRREGTRWQKTERTDPAEATQRCRTQSWGQGQPSRGVGGRGHTARASPQLVGTNPCDAQDENQTPEASGHAAKRNANEAVNGETSAAVGSGRMGGRRGSGGRGRDSGRGRIPPNKEGPADAGTTSQSDSQHKGMEGPSTAVASSSERTPKLAKVNAQASALAAKAATAAGKADATVAPEVFLQAISALQGIKPVSGFSIYCVCGTCQGSFTTYLHCSNLGMHPVRQGILCHAFAMYLGR
jgi:hypothetical protein